MSRIVLEVQDVDHSYGSQPILQSVGFSLAEGRIACLLGASGCGKTTLLRCIAGFETIKSGSIVLNQRLVSSRNHCLPPEKRRVGVLFQDYALFPHLTVEQNIAFGIAHLGKTERNDKIRHLLHSVALEDYAKRYPNELSGGQQQRVALARALAPEPELLLLDEPFSNLDAALRERMKHELKILLQFFGVTALIVTHNQDEAFDMADEIGVMAAGRIVQWGAAEELYHRPQNRLVAELLGTGTFLNAEVKHPGLLHSELGDLSCSMEYSRGSQLKILLRPDDIKHDQSSPLRAQVKRVAFRGMYRVYQLKLLSGTDLQCLVPGQEQLPEIGSEIGIRLTVQRAVVLRD